MWRRQLERIAFSSDWGRQMRFIAGPRQSGKTTLAREFLKSKNQSDLYYNWDTIQVKRLYQEDPYFFYSDILKKGIKSPYWVCYDEIHKIRSWKNILKDHFDSHEDSTIFIVTGSARLDLIRRTGESLAGRFLLFRLYPLTLAELSRSKLDKMIGESAVDFIESRISNTSFRQDNLNDLLEWSGFPEPLRIGQSAFFQKWQDSYIDTIIRGDLRDLTQIQDLDRVLNLVLLLPTKVGSPLSVNSLTGDIQCSQPTLSRYLKALQLIYMVFFVPPYTRKLSRLIRKEKKIYLFNWAAIENEGSRFENYVAVELLNLLEIWNHQGRGRFALYFVRTKDKKETDFLVTRNNEPYLMFETKLNATNIAPHNIRQAQQLGDVPLVQIIKKNQVVRKIGKGNYVVSASRFFS